MYFVSELLLIHPNLITHTHRPTTANDLAEFFECSFLIDSHGYVGCKEVCEEDVVVNHSIH